MKNKEIKVMGGDLKISSISKEMEEKNTQFRTKKHESRD